MKFLLFALSLLGVDTASEGDPFGPCQAGGVFPLFCDKGATGTWSTVNVDGTPLYIESGLQVYGYKGDAVQCDCGAGPIGPPVGPKDEEDASGGNCDGLKCFNCCAGEKKDVETCNAELGCSCDYQLECGVVQQPGEPVAPPDSVASSIPGCECSLSKCCEWADAGQDPSTMPSTCILLYDYDIEQICQDLADNKRADSEASICDIPEVQEGPFTRLTKNDAAPCAPLPLRTCSIIADTSISHPVIPQPAGKTVCSSGCARGMCAAMSYACEGDSIPMNVMAEPDDDKTCPPPSGTVGPNLLFGAATADGNGGARGACTNVESDDGAFIGSITTTLTGPWPCEVPETPSPSPAPGSDGATATGLGLLVGLLAALAALVLA